MRRLALIPVVLLGLWTGGAFGSSHRATESAAVGKIGALTAKSITVDGKHALTCRVGKLSPSLAGFAVGDRVGIGCSHGALRRMKRLPAGAATSGTVRVLGRRTIAVAGDRKLTCRLGDRSPDVAEIEVGDKVAIACADGVLVKLAQPSAQPEVTTAGGTVTALDASSITVRGERNLTCRLTADSPISREFEVGDQVGIACVDGVVVKIVRLPRAAEPATTTTSPVTATGEIDALTSTSIKLVGERDLACRLTDGSPSLTGFKIGDHVRISCLNGVLTSIARPESAPTITTTTTTTEHSTATYGTGAISAIAPTSISVKGEHDLTCTVGPASPKLGDYKVGDKVKITCVEGVLSAIALTAPTTATVTLSATGAITAIGESSIGVHGDRDTTCAVNAASPKLGDYKLGDRVKISCSNGLLTGIARIS